MERKVKVEVKVLKNNISRLLRGVQQPLVLAFHELVRNGIEEIDWLMPSEALIRSLIENGSPIPERPNSTVAVLLVTVDGFKVSRYYLDAEDLSFAFKKAERRLYELRMEIKNLKNT